MSTNDNRTITARIFLTDGSDDTYIGKLLLDLRPVLGGNLAFVHGRDILTGQICSIGGTIDTVSKEAYMDIRVIKSSLTSIPHLIESPFERITGDDDE